jgi:hypothetical protein
MDDPNSIPSSSHSAAGGTAHAGGSLQHHAHEFDGGDSVTTSGGALEEEGAKVREGLTSVFVCVG